MGRRIRPDARNGINSNNQTFVRGVGLTPWFAAQTLMEAKSIFSREIICNKVRLQVELTGAAVLATFWSTLRQAHVLGLRWWSSAATIRRLVLVRTLVAAALASFKLLGVHATRVDPEVDPPTAVAVVGSDEAGDNTGSKAYEGVGKVTSHAQRKRDESSDSESSLLQKGPVATTTNAVTVVVIADHVHPRRRRLQRRVMMWAQGRHARATAMGDGGSGSAAGSVQYIAIKIFCTVYKSYSSLIELPQDLFRGEKQEKRRQHSATGDKYEITQLLAVCRPSITR
ncbi:hypothetical protein EDB83DRAFT_2556824 [Lactarius deliciosus]|nr:hypothetical protein EDB83DRAFT_2556824 [Lactarius deliciosus]